MSFPSVNQQSGENSGVIGIFACFLGSGISCFYFSISGFAFSDIQVLVMRGMFKSLLLRVLTSVGTYKKCSLPSFEFGEKTSPNVCMAPQNL